MDDDDTSPPLAHGRSPTHLLPTKRALASSAHNQVACTREPIPWEMSPTIVPPGPFDRTSKPSHHNPFKKRGEIRPRVVNGPRDRTVASRQKFPSDWNLDPEEKKRKSEVSLPLVFDSKGKPSKLIALGSRQRMTSRS